MYQLESRTEILFAAGASLDTTKDLLTYSSSVLEADQMKGLPRHFPLSPEMHVAAWQAYANEAESNNVWETIKTRLVQLNFPILKGISKSPAYLAATRQGKPVKQIPEAVGFVLKRPDKLQLRLHPCLSGVMPALITGERDDFETLAQALVGRNEPIKIPPSVGSFMIKGYNNWDRIHQLKLHWELENPSDTSEASWVIEFTKHVFPHKQLFQDTFLLLSDGPYSGVPATDMGLSEEEWKRVSLEIRLEHESTHYFFYRLGGAIRNHALDELIADYQGVTAGAGRYRADWFLRFMGLEAFPNYRESGRLAYYRGNPPLSDEAFAIVQKLVYQAADNLEHFEQKYGEKLKTPAVQARFLLTLALMTLEELSTNETVERLEQALV